MMYLNAFRLRGESGDDQEADEIMELEQPKILPQKTEK